MKNDLIGMANALLISLANVLIGMNNDLIGRFD